MVSGITASHCSWRHKNMEGTLPMAIRTAKRLLKNPDYPFIAKLRIRVNTYRSQYSL